MSGWQALLQYTTDMGSIVLATAKVNVEMENILQSDFIRTGLKPDSLQTANVPDSSLILYACDPQHSCLAGFLLHFRTE